MIYRIAILSAVLMAGIGFTPPAYAIACAEVPFVGCKSDGQVGPQDAPIGKPKTIAISPQLAQRVAYYKASDGEGVLGPRGWYCFGTYGSSGSNLYVTPMPLKSADLFSNSWKGISSFGIQISVSNGDTSGRFEVAQIIARVFPAHSAFVRRVIAEGVEPSTSFPYGPYPADKLTYKSKETVEYITPPNTEGLGTKSFLIKDADPIDGVAILTGEELSLTHLSVRLSPEMSDLLPVIIRQVEQDISQSVSSGSATASGQNATPESCAKLNLAYEYHGDTGTSSCVPHAGGQNVPPENLDAMPNGVKESPAGCLEATAHTNGPCKITYPNGNIMETGADGTTWITIKRRDIKFQVFSGIPVTGQFQTIIITKLPEGDIIQAPQFEKTSILGDCQSESYQIMGTAMTDPNGVFNSGTGPENVARRVIPDTPVDIVFHVFCDAPPQLNPERK
ncbi:MAG: hypothetical protein ACLP00_28260 [Terracidiphilus sp.]